MAAAHGGRIELVAGASPSSASPSSASPSSPSASSPSASSSSALRRQWTTLAAPVAAGTQEIRIHSPDAHIGSATEPDQVWSWVGKDILIAPSGNQQKTKMACFHSTKKKSVTALATSVKWIHLKCVTFTRESTHGTRAYTYAHTLTYPHTLARGNSNTLTLTLTCAHAHAHTHARTHPHTLARKSSYTLTLTCA
jgi:hypothetical protein